MTEPGSPKERFVGGDRLVTDGARLVVYAPPTDGWEVRKFRRTAIVVDGARYYVADKTVLNPKMLKYVLEPWRDDNTDLPGGEVVYDEAFVLTRDVAASERRLRTRGRLARWALQPLNGFRWNATKERLHAQYGYHPVHLTKSSLFVQWAVILLVGSQLIFSAFFGPAAVLVVLFVVAVLGVDAFFRYADLFHDDPRAYGFYEWLLQPRKREY